MAKTKVPETTPEAVELPECPHTPRESWPLDCLPAGPGADRYKLSDTHQAAYGALTIARLLRQDTLLAMYVAEADKPEEEAQPFRGNVRDGLEHALESCLNVVMSCTSALSKGAL